MSIHSQVTHMGTGSNTQTFFKKQRLCGEQLHSELTGGDLTLCSTKRVLVFLWKMGLRTTSASGGKPPRFHLVILSTRKPSEHLWLKHLY